MSPYDYLLLHGFSACVRGTYMLALGIELLRLHTPAERCAVQLTKDLYPAIGKAVPDCGSGLRAERCMRSAIEQQYEGMSQQERVELYGDRRRRPTVGEALHRLCRGYELALMHCAELREAAKAARPE